jgi:hypothetical protein
MMRRITSVVVGVAMIVVCSVRLQAQTFEETLHNLSLDAAKAYVNPIVSGFGADLNGGWFHRAPKATMFSFDLEVGVVAMGTYFKDENKTFSSSGNFSFSQSEAMAIAATGLSGAGIPSIYQASVQSSIASQIASQAWSLGVSGPTVVGSKTDFVKIHFEGKTFTGTVPGYGNFSVDVPGQDVTTPASGFLGDLKMLPLAAPQLSIGTIAGTQFTFRYLPSQDVKNLGKATYFGWGLQHNPALWLGGVDALPVDLSLSFFTQKIKFGDLFQSKATAFGVNVSKRLGWGFLNLTPYAGFMLESSTMSFAYDATFPDPTQNGALTMQHISFDVDGANKSRLVLGLSVKLLFINVNADYNIGKYNSFTGGVMFII